MRTNGGALQSNRHIRTKWMQKLASYDGHGHRSEVEKIASEFCSGRRCVVVERFEGAFNYCFKVHFDADHPDWLIRFPIPGDTMRPIEKINQEVAVMKFIREKTKIPIPKVIASSVAKGQFAGLGPFIIMEFIDGQRLDEARYQNDKIKPKVEQSTLNFIYKQMAQIYLELDCHDFDRIGGLSLSPDDGSWCVGSGPLTLKMNEGQRMTGLELYDHNMPYWTTSLYLEELISQHTRLLCENPTAVSDKDEYREEYRCLHTIKGLTKQFVSSANCTGPFKLFLDDIRFGNILVDEKTVEIKALIDWEFCYTAPRQFLRSPPPWLIPNPDPWDWTSEDRVMYRSYFFKFLRVLQEEESKSGRDHSFSTEMQNLLENVIFWYIQAVREPLCCLELMHNWSAETGLPLEEPIDTEEFDMRFKTQIV